MNYRDVYKQVCRHAAEHLYSLEIYEFFDDEDADRVDRAIGEIQDQLLRKAERSRKEREYANKNIELCP